MKMQKALSVPGQFPHAHYPSFLRVPWINNEAFMQAKQSEPKPGALHETSVVRQRSPSRSYSGRSTFPAFDLLCSSYQQGASLWGARFTCWCGSRSNVPHDFPLEASKGSNAAFPYCVL